jgi:hypothetical protein
VSGITEPEDFRAHAWLEGDPTATADDAGLEASMLNVTRGERSTPASKENSGSGEAGGLRDGTPTTFDARSCAAPHLTTEGAIPNPLSSPPAERAPLRLPQR